MSEPTWIWLRGLTRESSHWGDALEQAKSFAPVVAIDLPGTGSNCREVSPMSIEKIAHAVRSEAIQRGLEFPVRLLGLSMGAMVAHAWQTRHPEEVDALVLINTSFGAVSPFYHRLSLRSIPMIILGFIVPASRREQIIFNLTCLKKDTNTLVLDAWNSIQAERPVRRSTFLRQLIAAATYRPSIERPSCEVELWLSEKDTLVKPICSERISKLWQAHVQRCPISAHDISMDAPAWLIEKFTNVNRNLQRLS